jgi:uncharacterized damage-inducible protein DinB
MERIHPIRDADERTGLVMNLDYQRATLLSKVAGLTEEQARWSPVPSGTSLFGLVAHLTSVERWWFARCVGNLDVEFPWTDEDPDADWRGPEGATLDSIVADYERECARSNEVLAAASLDARSVERPRCTVRGIALHMVEETARHNGHADILRELIDGTTGD